METILSMVGTGMLCSLPSVMVPGLSDPNSDIKVDFSTLTLLVSCVTPALLIGHFTSPLLEKRYGRQLTYGLIIIPGFIGSFLMYFTQNLRILFIARLACGYTSGAYGKHTGTLIRQCAVVENRGFIFTLKSVASYFGITIVHILSLYCDWRTISLLSLIPYLIILFVTFAYKESPWMFLKPNINPMTNTKLKEVTVNAQDRNEPTNNKTILVYLKKFTESDFIEPMFIIFVAVVLKDILGQYVYGAYLFQMIDKINLTESSRSYYYILSADLLMIVSGVFGQELVECKRRKILFTTSILSLGILLAMPIYNFCVPPFFTDKNEITIYMFLLYLTLNNLAAVALSNVAVEVVPLMHGRAGPVTTALIISTNVFLFLQFLPFLLKYMDLYVIFLIIASIKVIGLSFLYFYLPETKDRKMAELTYYFRNGHFKNSPVLVSVKTV